MTFMQESSWEKITNAIADMNKHVYWTLTDQEHSTKTYI